MKRFNISIFGFVAVLMLWSCESKPGSDSASSESQAEEWKAMEDFHMIMAESFHPFKDSANLEPAKRYAREMLSLADTWVNEQPPASVDNEAVKELLSDLRDGAVEFVDLVEVGDDEAIGASLTDLHDTFHHLQEAWYKKDDH